MDLPGIVVEMEPAKRREGLLVGAVAGAALAAATAAAADPEAVRATLRGGEVSPVAPPPGRRLPATALGDALLLELTSGGVDLHRLAGRWVEWLQRDGWNVDPVLQQALGHLAEFDAPADALTGGNAAALAAALPAALASASPRTMVSGTFHVARMLDPDPMTGLCAVALVLAAATILEGRRDLIPDVVAALRANDAPATLLDAVRFIPRDPRDVPAVPVGPSPDPATVTVWLLWQLHHRARGSTALRELALHGAISPTVGSLAGALFAARDGMTDWPASWLAGSGDDVTLRQALARRLGT
ncbi:MAG TPA: ADP-ribosylglycohydrolase family protein [Gemmatimonadales bacterium]|jgi:hypothetical protein